MCDPSRDVDDVDRAVAEDLIRDRNVARAGITGSRDAGAALPCNVRGASLRLVERSDELVAAPMPRFDEARLLRVVIERRGKTDLDALAPSLANDAVAAEWWSTYLRIGASPGAALALARFNTQIDTRDVLPVIQVPTLILHRTGDREVSVEEARYIAARIPGATLVELPGRDHLVYAGDVDRIADEIQQFVTAVEARSPIERVLSTIAVLDGRECDSASLSAVVARYCAAHRGNVVRSASNQWVVSFDGPGRAIRAACDIAAAGKESGCCVRAGIHAGECDVANGTLEGPPIVIASALATRASPGHVLVTRTVSDLVTGSRFRFDVAAPLALGEAGEWPIYEATADTK
jgi:hypothetical protein